MGFSPTGEQTAILDAWRGGGNLAIEAGAGSGKTATVKMLAESSLNRRGTYVAFNKAIAQEAKGKFPGSTSCETVHKLAWLAMVNNNPVNREKLGRSRQHSRDVAKILGIRNPVQVRRDKPVGPEMLARLTMETLARFCHSDHDSPNRWNVPHQDGLNDDEALAVLREVLPSLAEKAWGDLHSKQGKLKMTPDHFLKAWQQTSPKLPGDYVLLDEAQDTNPVVMSIIKNQEHMQKVLVGDPAQQLYCQPVGTQVIVPSVPESMDTTIRGRRVETTSVPIEELRPGDMVVTYSNSHVYKRGRQVTSVTRFPYEGRLVRVATSTGLTSAYTPEHQCIVRAGRDLENKHVVYLMQRGEHFRIGRVPFRYASQHGGFGVGLRSRNEGAEAAWILSMHDTAHDAALAEALNQHRFNLPGVRFEPTHTRDVLDVRAFWRKLGSNRDSAVQCLAEHGRLIEFPLWTAGRNYTMTARRPFVTAAANLLDGFKVLPAGAEVQYEGKRSYAAPASQWVPVTVSHEWYSGDILSLEVDDHHTYYADGILTHNSWRGAVDAMSQFDYPQLQLSQSFRFGPAIAEEANKWLELAGSSLRLTGNPERGSVVDDLPEMDAVLCRSNVKAFTELTNLLKQGHEVAIPRRVYDQLRSLAGAAKDLMAGRPTRNQELAAFDTWDEVQDFAENDPSGGHLAAFVKLVNIHGPAGIFATLADTVSEDEADVEISTVHTAKGREWGRVRVADDFPEPKSVEDGGAGWPTPEECRVAYVAVTRAQGVLDRSGLAWVDDYASASSAPAGDEASTDAEENERVADSARTRGHLTLVAG